MRVKRGGCWIRKLGVGDEAGRAAAIAGHIEQSQ
jgi:hypothetical protein